MSNKNSGFLYILENSDNKNVKIGVSKNPKDRIQLLKTQGGFRSNKQKIFGPFDNYFELENFLHDHFKKYRFIGEWFNIDYDETVNIISNMPDKEKIKRRVKIKYTVKSKIKMKGKVKKNKVKIIKLSYRQNKLLKHIEENGEFLYNTKKGRKIFTIDTVLSLFYKGLIIDVKSKDLDYIRWIKTDKEINEIQR